MRLCVPPTNDSAAAIQDAADKLARDTPRYDVGRIVLEGKYGIARPVTINSEGGRVVVIDARDGAYCEWTGDKTDKYMFRVIGCGDRAPATVVQGLMVNCLRKCRGVAIERHQRHVLLRDSYIWQSRQVGLALHDCWGSSAHDSSIMSCIGVGVWGTTFNSASLNNVRAQSHSCHHASWAAAANKELWSYTLTHGRDVAIQHYGAEFVEDWPAELPDDQRGCLVLQGGNQRITSLVLDSSYQLDYPLIYTSGRYAAIDGVRIEGTMCRLAKVVWRGDAKYRDGCVSISRVDGACAGASGSCRAFLELRGQTYGARVADSYLHTLRDNVIYAANGQHTRASVERVQTVGNQIARVHFLGHAVDAVITPNNAIGP